MRYFRRLMHNSLDVAKNIFIRKEKYQASKSNIAAIIFIIRLALNILKSSRTTMVTQTQKLLLLSFLLSYMIIATIAMNCPLCLKKRSIFNPYDKAPSYDKRQYGMPNPYDDFDEDDFDDYGFDDDDFDDFYDFGLGDDYEEYGGEYGEYTEYGEYY
ncbi:2389_t:CDS:1 [Dentiscutata erythropus]|uniref:2389_t:CDS:1 n=1 Tax=Dentiscutata erythropus TaxID=1348616 RepID=A0A9N9NPW1_9GLOM|nr:2389_t:CDS:1 [Dentiscutata erythropus]